MLQILFLKFFMTNRLFTCCLEICLFQVVILRFWTAGGLLQSQVQEERHNQSFDLDKCLIWRYLLCTSLVTGLTFISICEPSVSATFTASEVPIRPWSSGVLFCFIVRFAFSCNTACSIYCEFLRCVIIRKISSLDCFQVGLVPPRSIKSFQINWSNSFKNSAEIFIKIELIH